MIKIFVIMVQFKYNFFFLTFNIISLSKHSGNMHPTMVRNMVLLFSN